MLKELLQLLNGMLLEKEFVLSTKMFKILSSMPNPIAKHLLDLHNNGMDGGNSYIDIHPEKLGDITMLPANKIEKIPSQELWTSTSRTPTGVGRLIRSVLIKMGFKEEKGILKLDGFTDISGRDIELFVNEFKALQKTQTESNTKEEFKIVDGEDIRKFYLWRNYYENKGTLGSSCMKGGDCQRYLDIYVKEPNIKMLIYLHTDENGEEKIMGRALIWEEMEVVNHDSIEHVAKHITFMDRVYYTEKYFEDLFKKYAAEQGWWTKKKESYSDRTSIIRGEEEADDVLMKFTLEHDYSDRATPYMDTMVNYANDYPDFLTNQWVNETTKTWDSTNGNRCDDCDGSGSSTCYDCDGDGSEECGECSGSGDCSQCESVGKLPCDNCDGVGTVDDDIECGDCEGVGEVDCDTCNGGGSCEMCDGEGTEECSNCYGSGEIDCYECSY
jgi:hypothetical protein